LIVLGSLARSAQASKWARLVGKAVKEALAEFDTGDVQR
jgi:hypothetical protein